MRACICSQGNSASENVPRVKHAWSVWKAWNVKQEMEAAVLIRGGGDEAFVWFQANSAGNRECKQYVSS